MTVAIRHPELSESAAAAEVLNAHSRRFFGVDDQTPAEVEQFWTGPEMTFPNDVFVADREGDLVGYVDTIAFGKSSWVDVRALDSEVYDPLLEAALPRAGEQRTDQVRAFAFEGDHEAISALERHGFAPIRHGFRMMIELSGELPEPEWPAGYAIRPFREGDERGFYDAHQDSFADTWEFTSESFEQWSHWFMNPAVFQPEHWFAVEKDGALAGIAICRQPETEPGLGWVRILGVRPEHRRRGLALALLRHIFRHFAALSMERVGLGVDGESPTGAVALYERAGMRVVRRNVTYERVTG